MSFTADQVFDTGDHEPVSIASTSMIEHVAIPAINQTFDAIGKTPLDPKRVKLKSYGERKLRQLQAGVRETLQMNKPKDNFEEILSQLKVKFKDATRSEKIQILTILPKSWSIRPLTNSMSGLRITLLELQPYSAPRVTLLNMKHF